MAAIQKPLTLEFLKQELEEQYNALENRAKDEETKAIELANCYKKNLQDLLQKLENDKDSFETDRNRLDNQCKKLYNLSCNKPTNISTKLDAEKEKYHNLVIKLSSDWDIIVQKKKMIQINEYENKLNIINNQRKLAEIAFEKEKRLFVAMKFKRDEFNAAKKQQINEALFREKQRKNFYKEIDNNYNDNSTHIQTMSIHEQTKNFNLNNIELESSKNNIKNVEIEKQEINIGNNRDDEKQEILNNDNKDNAYDNNDKIEIDNTENNIQKNENIIVENIENKIKKNEYDNKMELENNENKLEKNVNKIKEYMDKQNINELESPDVVIIKQNKNNKPKLSLLDRKNKISKPPNKLKFSLLDLGSSASISVSEEDSTDGGDNNNNNGKTNKDGEMSPNKVELNGFGIKSRLNDFSDDDNGSPNGEKKFGRNISRKSIRDDDDFEF